MAVPWLPREVSARLAERPHEVENMRATYLISTAFVGGLLARDDGRRPSWFDRLHLAPASALTPDQQESLANVTHIVTTKMRREVTADVVNVGGKPSTNWQAGLLFARVLWRALFAAAAAKASMGEAAVPILFMTACQTLKSAVLKLLTQIWLEAQEQFTSRCNKYRNMKSRPAWSVLEALEHQVLAGSCNFGVRDPAAAPPAAKGKQPAANLQYFLEEVLALRFAADWLEAAMIDAQDFLDQGFRRAYRRPPKVGMDPVSMQLAELKQQYTDNFDLMWTDDAEARGVASLAARALEELDGDAALSFAATQAGLILASLWKGAAPMLSRYAALCISRLVESQEAVSVLPPPRLEEKDEDVSQTHVFHLVAGSYASPSSDTLDLVSALPRGIRLAIVKVQAAFRGFLFRSRYFGRTREVSLFCIAKRWPRLAPLLDLEEDLEPKEVRKRKTVRPEAAPAAEEKQQSSRPPTAMRASRSDLGSASTQRGSIKVPSRPTSSRPTSPLRSSLLRTEKRAWPLPTADHRACADLFALYMYSMYRRRELTGMWRTICGAYERGMGAFSELLTRNPALRPMLESIAAQLKRGSVVGYDKAFIAKQKKGEEGAHPGRMKPGEELFRRRDARQRPRDDAHGAGAPGGSASPAGGGRLAMGSSSSAPQLAPPRPFQSKDDKKANKEMKLTEEYLTSYLKEMDGDDSQFKDISSSVIPLSTGTSPPRVSPPDAILGDSGRPSSSGGQEDEERPGMSPTAGPASPSKRAVARPKLEVPFCMQRTKPMWLPIKAHRFASYRAKVLQLLPQSVLQQYIEFEKQGQYAACIKLLESATPGSLNVLNPAALVNNKPLLVETVLQLIVGYSGLCLRNKQGSVAVRLITQVIDNMSLSLRDLHPGHRTVLEAYLYDTALSVCYYMPADVALTDRAESFFLQASDRYLKLGHSNRYCKCCLRAAAVLHGQGNRSEAEYYTQQALNKLADAPMSSLLAVCYHNLAVHTVVQQRISDAVAHVRAYVALLKQLPKLGSTWMQTMDNTQWLILKIQELWPQYQVQQGMRESQHEGIVGNTD